MNRMRAKLLSIEIVWEYESVIISVVFLMIESELL